jgi:anti-anti-sigma factor
MSDLERLSGAAVVVLPDEIDLSNAGPVGEQLVAAIVPGVTVAIADLSMTTFCDCAGVRSLLLAHREATVRDAELRLVVRSRAVLRILELLGADQVLPVYPDLSAALAGGLICTGAEGAYLPESAVAALSV